MISKSRLKSIIQSDYITNVQMITDTWGERTIKVKVYTFVEPDIMGIRDNVYVLSTLIGDNEKVVKRGYSYIIHVQNIQCLKELKIIKTPTPSPELIQAVVAEHFFANDSLRAVQKIRRVNY